MLDLVLAASSLQERLDDLGLPNCIIGGLALQAWGEVRVTRDADFTVLTRFEDEASKAEAILALITPRIPDALRFAIENRVLLGFMDQNIPVDIGLGGFEFEERIIGRAVEVELSPSTFLRVCGAEDLIVLKAFAGRDQDWTDIRGILYRQANLDWAKITEELEPLTELIGEPARLERLLAMRTA